MKFSKIIFHQQLTQEVKIMRLFHLKFEQYENKDTMHMGQE